jgi:hypothetical protein
MAAGPAHSWIYSITAIDQSTNRYLAAGTVYYTVLYTVQFISITEELIDF